MYGQRAHYTVDFKKNIQYNKSVNTFERNFGCMNEEELKKPISDKIAAALRIKILKGEYLNGEHLNEVRIAEEYNVSRGPVRDAVKMLEKEGFASTPRNGRTTAISFTKKDFLDFHELRFYIEKEAISNIIRNADADPNFDAWLNAVGRYISSMEKSMLHYDESIFNANDYRFHYALMQKADNRIMMNVWESYNGVRSAIMAVNSQYLSYEKVVDVIFGPHLDIYNSIKKRDVESAVKNVRIHMNNSINIYEAAYK